MDWTRFSNPRKTITLLHGTEQSNARRFAERGISFDESGSGVMLYLTDSESLARVYASWVAEMKSGRAKGSIIAVTVPTSALRPDDFAYRLMNTVLKKEKKPLVKVSTWKKSLALFASVATRRNILAKDIRIVEADIPQGVTEIVDDRPMVRRFMAP